MKWPKPVLDAFNQALDVEPVEGLDKRAVINAMLDETARRASWRAGGNPLNAGPALRLPMTPLGSVTNDGIAGKALSFTIHGQYWGAAVELFHNYVEENAEAIFAECGTEHPGYDHDVGFGSFTSAPAETNDVAEPNAG